MGSETDFECGEVEVKDVAAKASLEPSKKHTCPYNGCRSSFNRPWKLQRHIYTHTKERPFKCDFLGCSKDYMNKSHLDRHKAVSHAENKPLPVYISCPFPECNKVFMNKWSLKKHCNTHKAKNLYKCDFCGVTFNKHKQLQNHFYAHMGVRPFECQTCKETFQTGRELKSHERKHKTYTCDHEGCNEEFNSWNALRTHSKVSHSVFYRCDSCGKAYKNKWTLTEHVLSHLPVDKRDVLMCSYSNCGRYYFHNRNLKAHIKSFHQNINHKCDIDNCERSFTKRVHLEKHKRLHEEPKLPKENPARATQPRKPRKDKGTHRKSMAAALSGIILPENVSRSLAQGDVTPEVLECIEKVKAVIAREKDKSETSGKEEEVGS